jgi:hypothetical protein
MMFILRDDAVIEIFESQDEPPKWIEAIDIENEEFRFCDDRGQRYLGVITQKSGWFAPAKFELRPDGIPDFKNAIALLDSAVALKPDQRFADLQSLRDYIGTVGSN